MQRVIFRTFLSAVAYCIVTTICVFSQFDVHIEPQVDSTRIKPLLDIVNDNPGTVRGAEAHYEIAMLHFNARAYTTAADEFQKVVQNYPVFQLTADAQYHLARSYSRLYRDDDAIAAARVVVAQFPAQKKWRDEALNLIGWSYYIQGKYTYAIREFENIVKNYPDCYYADDAWMKIGRSYKKLGMYDQAIEAFSKVITDFPPNNHQNEAQLEIGFLHMMRGREDSALEELQKVIDLYPSEKGKSKAQYEIGNILFGMRKYEEAVEAYKRVVDLYPEEQVAPYASFRVGYCLMLMEDYEQAVQAFAQTDNSYPDFANRDWLLFFWGRSLQRNGDESHAGLIYDILVSEFPGSNLINSINR